MLDIKDIDQILLIFFSRHQGHRPDGPGLRRHEAAGRVQVKFQNIIPITWFSLCPNKKNNLTFSLVCVLEMALQILHPNIHYFFLKISGERQLKEL